MKKVIAVLGFLILLTCDSEKANDCIQTSGPIIQQEFQVETFTKILVNRGIELILKQEDDFEVIVEVGENLLNDISINVIEEQLVLTDNNNCNYFRDYESTKVYVSAPNITEIRSSTQYDISSYGALNYSNLELFSDDFFAPDSYTIGDFRLIVSCEELRILTNNLSSQYISGTTNKLNINFASGAGRFEGGNLVAQEVFVNHRGSNDMIVNPQQSLTGILRGTGNLISVNEPPIVDVERLYTGQLIFN